MDVLCGLDGSGCVTVVVVVMMVAVVVVVAAGVQVIRHPTHGFFQH